MQATGEIHRRRAALAGSVHTRFRRRRRTPLLLPGRQQETSDRTGLPLPSQPASQRLSQPASGSLSPAARLTGWNECASLLSSLLCCVVLCCAVWVVGCVVVWVGGSPLRPAGVWCGVRRSGPCGGRSVSQSLLSCSLLVWSVGLACWRQRGGGVTIEARKEGRKGRGGRGAGCVRASPERTLQLSAQCTHTQILVPALPALFSSLLFSLSPPLHHSVSSSQPASQPAMPRAYQAKPQYPVIDADPEPGGSRRVRPPPA